jgi:hypothetical protein
MPLTLRLTIIAAATGLLAGVTAVGLLLVDANGDLRKTPAIAAISALGAIVVARATRRHERGLHRATESPLRGSHG